MALLASQSKGTFNMIVFSVTVNEIISKFLKQVGALKLVREVHSCVLCVRSKL